jgi:hypothetical protein
MHTNQEKKKLIHIFQITRKLSTLMHQASISKMHAGKQTDEPEDFLNFPVTV